MKFWADGLPFASIAVASINIGAMAFWADGLPAQFIGMAQAVTATPDLDAVANRQAFNYVIERIHKPKKQEKKPDIPSVDQQQLIVAARAKTKKPLPPELVDRLVTLEQQRIQPQTVPESQKSSAVPAWAIQHDLHVSPEIAAALERQRVTTRDDADVMSIIALLEAEDY